MQHRMLDTADILVDRQPVVGLGRVDALGRVRRGEAREIPRRFDEGVEGVGPHRVAGLPAARAVDVLPGRMPFQAGCRACRSRRPSGRATGRSFSGTGTMPQVPQWITGIGQPQLALARDAPSRAAASARWPPPFAGPLQRLDQPRPLASFGPEGTGWRPRGRPAGRCRAGRDVSCVGPVLAT